MIPKKNEKNSWDRRVDWMCVRVTFESHVNRITKSMIVHTRNVCTCIFDILVYYSKARSWRSNGIALWIIWIHKSWMKYRIYAFLYIYFAETHGNVVEIRTNKFTAAWRQRNQKERERERKKHSHIVYWVMCFVVMSLGVRVFTFSVYCFDLMDFKKLLRSYTQRTNDFWFCCA